MVLAPLIGQVRGGTARGCGSNMERRGWIRELFLRWKILAPDGEGDGRVKISNLDSWVVLKNIGEKQV